MAVRDLWAGERERGTGARWQARFAVVVNGKQQRRAKNFEHIDPATDPTEGRRAAEEWEATARSELLTGSSVPTRKSRTITVAAVWDEWIAIQQERGGYGGRGLSENTRVNYVGSWRNHIEPVFGRTRMSAFTTDDVQAWVDSFATATNPAALSKAFTRLKSLCDFAVRRGYATFNPCIDVDTGRNLHAVNQATTQGEAVTLTRRQAQRLIALGGDYSPLLRFALATGARWGEVIALRVGDLDLPADEWGSEEAHGYAVIARSRTSSDEEKEPKNGKTRTVPVPRDLALDLRKMVAGRSPDAPVFTGAKGGPLYYKWSTVLPRVFVQAMDRGRTGRGKGVMTNVQRAPRKPEKTMRKRTKIEPFGRIVRDAALLIHDVQAALNIEEVDTRTGHARYGERTAGRVAQWQEGEGIGDIDPSTLTAEQLTALLGKPVACDLRLRDADWQRPLDLRPKAERPGNWQDRTFGFHDLRHTAASLALEGGASPHTVQALLDHHSAAFTLERYAQATTDGMAATARALAF